MKVSDYMVDFFERQGLEHIFMVTGGGCMHMVNSFGSSKQIRYWCTHHEQCAAMAAEAYAKMKNDIGVVLTTSGPGATNTITGVLDCYQDSTPVIFISGQAKSRQTVLGAGIEGLRQFGVQEANIVPIVDSITKMAVEICDPNQIRYYLEKAVYEAKSGRPGPVWLSVPLDVQSAGINPKELPGFTPTEQNPVAATEEEIKLAADLLRQAERPVIVAGHGIRLAGACELLEKLAEQWQIPVVTPIMGIDVLCGSHPCNIGRVGTKGTRAGNFAMQNADLILSIGSRLSVSVVGHEYDLFARDARIVVVDIDRQEHLKKTIQWDELIQSDAGEFLEGLLQCSPVQADGWLNRCQEWKKKYPVVLEEYLDDSKGINYYQFMDIINRHMRAEMTVVSDAGSSFYVVAQTVDLKPGQRHITTGGTATMGFTLPAAIGVAAAEPEAAVIAVTGDGSFMQNLQELETLRYHNLNVKLFVMNNRGYFSIQQTQKKFFQGNLVGESDASGISFPDMEKIADAFGIRYYHLDTISESDRAMEQILEEKGPSIVEVKVTSDMEIIPTNASAMNSDGVLVSKPLEDMYPFLERQEFAAEMIVPPVNL